MMTKLLSSVVLILSLIGCNETQPVEAILPQESMANTNLFNDQELAMLKSTVKLMMDTYQESGLLGMKAHVEECYESPSSVVLTCVGADYVGHLLDTAISTENKFPLEAFFFENRVIARMVSNKEFDGKDLFVLFMAAASIKMKVSDYLDELPKSMSTSSL